MVRVALSSPALFPIDPSPGPPPDPPLICPSTMGAYKSPCGIDAVLKGVKSREYSLPRLGRDPHAMLPLPRPAPPIHHPSTPPRSVYKDGKHPTQSHMHMNGL